MPAILLEQRGAVAILTLNSPDQYNALSIDRMVEINEALDHALANPCTNCILLTGAGKGFCAGAQFGGEIFDLGAAIETQIRQQVSPIITKMRSGDKPVVVAVNGPAAGAGVGVALAGDIVIAARSASFHLSFVKLGATLDGGTSLLLQRSIGAARARALTLTGEALTAERAADWGLIWRWVEDELLMTEALAIAEQIAAGPPLAIAMMRKQLDDAWTSTLSETLEMEARHQGRAFMTEDLREGAAAFLDKRTPKFVGR